MKRFPAHVLALVAASFSMLLNLSLLTAGEHANDRLASFVSAASQEHEAAGESGSERFEEEREEESKFRVHLFAGRVSGEASDRPCCGLAGQHGLVTASADRPSTLCIRGPPAA